jgi:hypothetical protein
MDLNIIFPPEGQRQPGRPRRRWENNIKRDLQEVVWGTWTELICFRIGIGGKLLTNAVMNLRIP